MWRIPRSRSSCARDVVWDRSSHRSFQWSRVTGFDDAHYGGWFGLDVDYSFDQQCQGFEPSTLTWWSSLNSQTSFALPRFVARFADCGIVLTALVVVVVVADNASHSFFAQFRLGRYGVGHVAQQRVHGSGVYRWTTTIARHPVAGHGHHQKSHWRYR